MVATATQALSTGGGQLQAGRTLLRTALLLPSNQLYLNFWNKAKLTCLPDLAAPKDIDFFYVFFPAKTSSQ